MKVRRKTKPRKPAKKRSGASNFANPAAWLVDLLGGEKSASGQRISEKNALKVASFYNGVKVIAQSIASLPLITYRRLSPRGRERASDHWLYPLLHDSPNPEMTSFVFRMVLMVNALPWNNAYAIIQRDKSGRAVSLWPMHPSKLLRTKWGADKLDRYYIFQDEDGKEVNYHSSDIIHIRGVSLDGWDGLPLFGIAGESLGLTLAAQQYGAKFFGNNARPAVVLTHPGTLDEEAVVRLKQSWNAAYGGENAHGTAVLEEDMKLSTIATNNNESQFLETRQYQVPEACRWLDISPSKVHDHSHSTFSNIEHLDIEFAKHTIRPWCVNIEQELNRKLIPLQERAKLYIEFNLDGLLRGDYESRWRAYQVARQSGILSANEIRELENMNPIEGKAGDAYLINGNMISIDTAMENQVGNSVSGNQIPNDDARDAQLAALWNVYQPMFAEVGERMARRETNAASRVSPEALVEWCKRFYISHEQTVRVALGVVMDAYTQQRQSILGKAWVASESFNLTSRVADRFCQEGRSKIESNLSKVWQSRAGDALCEHVKAVLDVIES